MSAVEKMMCVMCGSYMGHSGDGCDFVSTLCKYFKYKLLKCFQYIDHIMRLFDILIRLILSFDRPILTFDCEVWGVGNYYVIEIVYLNFVTKLLCVKLTQTQHFFYAELCRFLLLLSTYSHDPC